MGLDGRWLARSGGGLNSDYVGIMEKKMETIIV